MTNITINGIKTYVIKKPANYEVQSNVSRSSHQELFLLKQSLSTHWTTKDLDSVFK